MLKDLWVCPQSMDFSTASTDRLIIVNLRQWNYKLFIHGWKKELDSTSGSWMQRSTKIKLFQSRCLYDFFFPYLADCSALWVPAEGLLYRGRLAVDVPIDFFQSFLLSWSRGPRSWIPKCRNANNPLRSLLEKLVDSWKVPPKILVHEV